ncbi:MAG: amidohydrolase [Candidatus Helarchaeota archaeon]
MFDLLITNAIIYPLDRENHIGQGMAIKGGKVVKIYEEERANSSITAKKVVDLNGKTIIPGFNDCHFHFIETAVLKKIGLYISEVIDGKLYPNNLDDIGQKIKSFAENLPKNRPILCYNYIIPSIEEDRLPFRQEIDKWCPDRIIIIVSMDGHSSSYSTKALKAMGISPNGHNGILKGEEHEFNMKRLKKIIEKSISISNLVNGIQDLLNDAIQHGIVGIHCLDGFDELKRDLTLWFLSFFGGLFPLYIRLYPQIRDANRVIPITKRMSYKRIGGCGGWEMDGSVNSQTAAFFEPYKNSEDNKGKCYFTQEEVNYYVKLANDLGFQICSHAIGTRAIERILSSYETILKKKEETRKKINPLRHRIEHFEFPTNDQVERAIDKLKILISAQPGYSWMDETFQQAYHKYLTPEQYQRQIPLKSIVERGGIILGSSDSPVQHLNPFIQIHGMVNFPIKKERLNIYQALRTYTYNATYSTFEETDRGTLTPGKNADFIILDKDPFKTPSSGLIDIKVLNTYIKGHKVNKIRLNILKLLLKSLFTKKKKI